MKKVLCLLLLLLGAAYTYAQSTILAARNLPNGSQVAVSGIVTNAGELGTIRYLQDETAGIAVYSNSVSSFQRGDSVSVVGFLTDYNGLLEISNLVGYVINSSSNPLPEPQVLSPAQLGEDYESELIRINDVIFNDGGGTFASNTSYYFSSNGESASIYVRSNHPLIGQIIPSIPVDIIGICSQFYSTYQVLLRNSNDIINENSINIISKVIQSNISTSGYDLNWLTDSTGTTEIEYGLTPQLEMGKLLFASNTTSHTATLSNLSPSALLYVKAYSVRGQDTAFAPVSAFITESMSSGDIKVYFTSSVDVSVSIISPAHFLDDAMDDTLIAYINRAKYSIDLAVYDSYPEGISDIAAALDAAHLRGVEIRLIVDTTWSPVTLGSLVDPAIPHLVAPAEEPYAIMHNKFVVIDAHSADPMDAILWTGSTNFEGQNINDFSNNVIILQDKSLAIAYWLEFNEMWGSSYNVPNPMESRFGPFKRNNTPHEFVIGGRRVQSYFSPSDGTNSKILECIESVDESLFVATMLITRSDLAYALRDKHQEGKTVQVLVNDKSSCTALVVSTLESALGNNFAENTETGILHHKYLIADPFNSGSDPLVLTGSHNWSNAAENTNDENTLIIHDQEVAQWFYQEFHARYLLNFLSSKEDDFNIQWKVYPNPVHDKLYIETKNAPSGTLTILDLQGRTVQSVNLEEAMQQGIDIKAARLKPGVYFIRIDEIHSQYNGKLIVY